MYGMQKPGFFCGFKHPHTTKNMYFLVFWFRGILLLSKGRRQRRKAKPKAKRQKNYDFSVTKNRGTIRVSKGTTVKFSHF